MAVDCGKEGAVSSSSRAASQTLPPFLDFVVRKMTVSSWTVRTAA